MVTPGKWIARIDEYAIDVIEEKSGFGIADIGTRKSLKDANYPSEQAEANAKLIAAAPDLLEACQQLFFAPHQEHFITRLNDEEMKGLEMIKAAIIKAVGS